MNVHTDVKTGIIQIHNTDRLIVTASHNLQLSLPLSVSTESVHISINEGEKEGWLLVMELTNEEPWAYAAGYPTTAMLS